MSASASSLPVFPSPGDAEAVIGDDSAPSIALSAEDARVFHELTSDEAARELRFPIRMRTALEFEVRIAAGPTNIMSNHATSATRLSEYDSSLFALLSAFTPAVLRQLIARMGDSLASGTPDECDVTSRVLSALCGVEGFATQMAELGALPVCVNVMRSEGVNPGLLWTTKMLSRMARECNGLHPLLSGGVLLPIALRMLSAPVAHLQIRGVVASQMRQVVATFLQTFSNDIQPLRFRPRIASPTMDRIAAANHHAAAQQAAHPSFMQRIDSDSLCSVISFLCGCDFLRVLRVCRRWSLLRVKPAAWPSSRPCSAHSASVVDAFFPLLDLNHFGFHAACTALSTLDAAGVRRLLELDGINRLMPLLDEERDLRSRFGVLGIIVRICFVNDAEFAPLVGQAGIVPKLVRLLLNSLAPLVGSRAAVVLTNVLFAEPARIDETMEVLADPDPQAPQVPMADPPAVSASSADSQRGGRGSACVRALFSMAAAGPSQTSSSNGIGCLACMALKGTEVHRRMLLAEGFLPLFVRFIVHQGASIVAPQVKASRTMLSILPRFFNRLEALRLLLETKRTMTDAAASAAPRTEADDNSLVAHASVPSCASAVAPLDATLRTQLEPLLHHWHDGIRSKVAAILRDYAD